jgi:hypothetical protein
MSKKTIREYLKAIGRRGGRARAERHSKREIAKWGGKRNRPRNRSTHARPKE